MMQEVNEPLLYNTDYADTASQISASVNQDPPHPTVIMDPRRHRPMSKRRTLKNLYVLSFSLFVYFLGFVALSNLQSTLNSVKGIGIDSQAAIYAASMIASLFLPELMVKYIGCKKTLVLTVICSIPYIASNFYPRWSTLIPTAVLLGIAAGPLTASQAIYTNEMARRFHKETALESFEVIAARFFGISSFFTENTQIWGNLISYYVLRPGMAPILNHTSIPCGVDFKNHGLNGTLNPNLQPPSDDKRYLLVGIYVLFGILSALMMMFFLDPLENDIEQEQTAKNKCASVLSRLTAAAKHATKHDQILLILISVYCGMETAFYTCNFTQVITILHFIS